MRGFKPKVVGQYRTIKELGRGAYGQVYLSKHLQTREIRALKALLQIELLGYDAQKKADAKRYLDTEIRAMREIKSEFVVRLYDMFSTKRRLYLVMEYCNEGSLAAKLQERLPFEEAARLFRELASALILMHDRKFVHRDLKPDNILLHNGSVKLGDFGLSKEVTERTVARTVVGTRLYMAPEVLQNIGNIDRQAYNQRVDYWSAGVVLYQMVSGMMLVNSKSEAELLRDQRNVCGDQALISSLEVPPDCKDLLRRLIVLDPNQRISPEEFRVHPFVTGVPRLSQIDFSSLVCFSKPPIYELCTSVALRLAALLCAWAERDSPENAFVYYVKACKALARHVDDDIDCQKSFCKALKEADACKPLVVQACPTLVIAERVAVYCEESKSAGKAEKVKCMKDALLLLDLVKAYPQIVTFKRRLERALRDS